MFCSKCGKQVRDGMNYCTNCGEPVKKDEGGENVNTKVGVNLKKDEDRVSPAGTLPPGKVNVSGQGNTGGNQTEKPKKNKGIKIVFITISGIILALLLILFALVQTGIISISIDDNTNQESVLDKKSKSSKREKEKERRAKEKESEEVDVTIEAHTEVTTAQTVQPATLPSTVAVNSEFILPDSSVRVLDKSELAGFSAEQCRLARNEIYAKHGRMFDDAGLQNYFNSRSWYHGTIPAKQFNDNMLSDIEIQNRNLIIAFEKEMGYTK